MGVNLLLVFVDKNLELDFVDVEMRLLFININISISFYKYKCDLYLVSRKISANYTFTWVNGSDLSRILCFLFLQKH